jgi:hypothetical protein
MNVVIAVRILFDSSRRRLRLVEDKGEAEAPASEKLCRELIRRFQAAINGIDVPAMLMLLGEEQPVSVRESPRLRIHAGACANDASYGLALAA